MGKLNRWYQTSILITIIFQTVNLHSQNELSTTNSLQALSNYNLVLKKYLQIYNDNPTNSQNTYNIACCYALLKNIDSAFYFLNKSIDLGQDDGLALSDYDLYYLHYDNRWKSIENRLEKIYKEKHLNINADLAWDISKMFFLDQALKLESDNIFKAYGLPSPQMDSIDRIIADVDSLNMINLERVFNKYGCMNQKLIGFEAMDRVFIIILHAPLNYQKKYFEFVESAVKNGELKKNSIAYLTDKILVKEGKNQLYGTQLKYLPKTKSYQFKTIENPGEVNIRRKEFGLGPIEEYAKDFGIDYKDHIEK